MSLSCSFILSETAVLPYVKGVSEVLRRCPQQQGVRTVFKSDATLRSHLVRPKDPITEPAKLDGVVYKIPCECGKVYIGETGIAIYQVGSWYEIHFALIILWNTAQILLDVQNSAGGLYPRIIETNFPYLTHVAVAPVLLQGRFW